MYNNGSWKKDDNFLCCLSFHMIANCQKTQVTQKPNILLICVDDLRPELKSFGADYIS